MTDNRFYTDETQRRIVYGSLGYGKTDALRRLVKFAGTIDTDGRWRPKRGRFAFIKAGLMLALDKGPVLVQVRK